jgi:hypothetical protein
VWEGERVKEEAHARGTKTEHHIDLTADEIMAKFDMNKDGVLDQKELNDLMDKIRVKTRNTLERQTNRNSDLHIAIK